MVKLKTENNVVITVSNNYIELHKQFDKQYKKFSAGEINELAWDEIAGDLASKFKLELANVDCNGENDSDVNFAVMDYLEGDNPAIA